MIAFEDRGTVSEICAAFGQQSRPFVCSFASLSSVSCDLMYPNTSSTRIHMNGRGGDRANPHPRWQTMNGLQLERGDGEQRLLCLTRIWPSPDSSSPAASAAGSRRVDRRTIVRPHRRILRRVASQEHKARARLRTDRM